MFPKTEIVLSEQSIVSIKIMFGNKIYNMCELCLFPFTENERLFWKPTGFFCSTEILGEDSVDNFDITKFYCCHHWHDFGVHSSKQWL